MASCLGDRRLCLRRRRSLSVSPVRSPLSHCRTIAHTSSLHTSDQLIEENIKRPFWILLFDVLWQDVDFDMKEAVDRRAGCEGGIMRRNIAISGCRGFLPFGRPTA